MDIINTEEVKGLAAFRGKNCVSIYIPTHVFGRETFEGEDTILFKNLIQKIDNQLSEKGMKQNDIDKMLMPAKKLITDTGFWRKQSEGLAVFISEGSFKYFHIPSHFEQFDIISDKFYLKPILPMFFENGYFYILALSKDVVKFYQCTRHSITNFDLEDFVPQGMEEALMYDDPQQSLQHHSGSGGKSNAMFHGQGGGRDDQKTDIARYLNAVDDGLMRLIKADKVPMVIAAVDYLIPIYKSVSKYNYIMDDGLMGNPEYVDMAELHSKSWAIAEPFFMKNRKKAMSNYLENPDASLVTSNIDRIIPAAHFKQVNQLFIEKNAAIWGRFDEVNNKLEIHNEYKEGDDDLINETAIHTFINGGEVYALPPEEMPDQNNKIAAVLRFS
ncbi:MAG: hypothetical protein H0X62_04515 [Bacteroidetes bacterium]|nr:hypothetical protein [Bacteroidota bacterium]